MGDGNDNIKPDMETSLECLPCLETSTFRALDDGSYIDLLIQSDKKLNDHTSLAPSIYNYHMQTRDLDEDCFKYYPLMCNLGVMLEGELSSDVSEVEYDDDSEYKYDSEYDHDRTLLDCGHPFSEFLGMIDSMVNNEPVSLFAPCDEPECNSTVLISSRKPISENRVFTDPDDVDEVVTDKCDSCSSCRCTSDTALGK